MCPEVRGDGDRAIAVGADFASEELIGKDSGLWQSVHVTADFGVDESIDSEGIELV